MSHDVTLSGWFENNTLYTYEWAFFGADPLDGPQDSPWTHFIVELLPGFRISQNIRIGHVGRDEDFTLRWPCNSDGISAVVRLSGGTP